MSLSVTTRIRPELSDSSIIDTVDEETVGDSEFESTSDTSSGSAVIDSVDEDSSASAEAPSLRSTTPPTTGASATSGCFTSWPALSAMRGVAEYVWQGSGRAVNTACFIALANVPGEASRIVATVASAVTAGYCGYRLCVTRIGKDSCSRVLAVAVGTAMSAGAGAAATYYGSALPALGVAGSGLLSFTLSGLLHQRQRDGHAVALLSSAVPPTLVVASGAASIAVAVSVPMLNAPDVGKLGRRTLALLAEAATTELLKGSTESLIPSANRQRLSFERRLKSGLIGMLPYAVASIAFSGVLGNLLRVQMRSERYEDYLAPLLVGALSNVVKGAVNTAVVRCGGELASCGSDDASAVRPAGGLLCPEPSVVLEKTALRFVLASARDIFYLSLVEAGLQDVPAACLAYALYAFFAQHRDLLFDMMQGEGWSEPQLRVRPDASSA